MSKDLDDFQDSFSVFVIEIWKCWVADPASRKNPVMLAIFWKWDIVLEGGCWKRWKFQNLNMKFRIKTKLYCLRANCASLVAFCDKMSGSAHEWNKRDGISIDLSNTSEIISCSILVAKLGRYGLDGWTWRSVINWLNLRAQRKLTNGSV